MIENKRFRVVNHDEFDYELDYIMDNYKRMHISDVCDLLNNFNEENKQLKQQLLCDSDSVCDICKHQYLTPKNNCFIAKCRKGHEDCSKEDIKYCEDFEFKELKEVVELKE